MNTEPQYYIEPGLQFHYNDEVKAPYLAVIGYLDYRLYLKDVYEHFKKTKSVFSFRYFANKAGLSSPALYKMAMEGQRNLTATTMKKFIRGLELPLDEAAYFQALVHYNQAKTDRARNQYFKTLRKYLEKREAKTLSLQQYDYFSSWYLPVIREMIACSDFTENSEKIAQALFGEISPEAIAQAITLMLELGLIDRSAGGDLASQSGHLKTDESLLHLALKNYHREMIQQATRSIERSTPEQRELQALTISIDPEKIPAAKVKVQEFIQEMRSLLRSKNKRQVYQLNVQFFNISNELEK